MAILLQIENLTKSVGDRMLFADFSLGVNEGDKIGIIAKNGAGKSTLLGSLAGINDYDSGRITFRNGVRVAYLGQDSVFDPALTVIDACLKAAPAPDEETHLDDGNTYALLNSSEELIGFYQFGAEARIPAAEDAYGPGYTDMGLGLRPDLCGLGFGGSFCLSGVRFAR